MGVSFRLSHQRHTLADDEFTFSVRNRGRVSAPCITYKYKAYQNWSNTAVDLWLSPPVLFAPQYPPASLRKLQAIRSSSAIYDRSVLAPQRYQPSVSQTALFRDTGFTVQYLTTGGASTEFTIHRDTFLQTLEWTQVLGSALRGPHDDALGCVVCQPPRLPLRPTANSWRPRSAYARLVTVASVPCIRVYSRRGYHGSEATWNTIHSTRFLGLQLHHGHAEEPSPTESLSSLGSVSSSADSRSTDGGKQYGVRWVDNTFNLDLEPIQWRTIGVSILPELFTLSFDGHNVTVCREDEAGGDVVYNPRQNGLWLPFLPPQLHIPPCVAYAASCPLGFSEVQHIAIMRHSEKLASTGGFSQRTTILVVSTVWLAPTDKRRALAGPGVSLDHAFPCPYHVRGSLGKTFGDV
ncbi:hypothetical protein LXA43DRAFT_1082928 [Ganoderma leucocontextum]|nr:hypothetical protein LXA43DRAFT_1082928 [Ganoderma leucocontextum]